MRLASYNVENLFERAVAMNQADWSAGRRARPDHAELSRLFNLKTYKAADCVEHASICPMAGFSGR